MNEQRARPVGGQHRWVDAATSADFVFYELAQPVSDDQQAGGFGFGDSAGTEGTVSLEVLHWVDGVEISVHTARNGRRAELPHHVNQQMRLSDLVLHSVLNGERSLTLPSRWDFTESDRMIAVDGLPASFVGVALAIDGSEFGGWVGAALDEDGNLITIRIDRPWNGTLAVARCTNLTMSDLPPGISRSQ